MAEGGYEPETTNPFDPHGDDHYDGDDDEKIPLIPFDKGKPSFKHPKGTSTPIQHSSTSARHNPSYFDEKTASGKLHSQEVLQDVAAEQIKDNFPNTDTSKYFSKMDGEVVYIKIKKRIRNVWHPIIHKDGDVMDVAKLPKTLRDALGKTAGEIITERINEMKEQRKE